jgi:flagellar motor switch protein FliN
LPEPAESTTASEPAAIGLDALAAGAAALELMLDLPLDVTVELGSATLQLGEALALQPGSIIELNRLPGEPLDMHINGRLVAHGEVVVVNDSLGLRVTEIIGREPH